jgi:hypothetical protein
MKSVRIALVLAAALAVAAVAAPDPAPPEDSVPFSRLVKGQTAECHESEGCVAMTVEAYRHLLVRAYKSGASSCSVGRTQL